MSYRLLCCCALTLLLLTTACRDGGDTYEAGSEPTEAPAATVPNVLTDAEAAAGWALLFDGTSPAGWRGYNRATFPTKGWRIDGGNLVLVPADPDAPGFAGDIVTEETFTDFELSVEFMMADTANSGIFYRVLEQDGAAIWYNAPEYQILDDETYLAMEAVNERQLSGANYDLHAPAVRALKPPGEWNHARIRIEGDAVEHWLNGQQTAAYTIGSPAWTALVAESKFSGYPDYGRTAEGRIGLQDHGQEVRFRNIKVRRL